MDMSKKYNFYQNDVRDEILKQCDKIIIWNEQDGYDKASILWALTACESSYCTDNSPRHEESFAPGGRYYNKKADMLFKKYGSISCCSIGPLQTMYLTAYELGFRKEPLDLFYPVNAVDIAIRYINIRCKGWKTLAELADAYNSGSFKDSRIPKDYIGKFVRAYWSSDLKGESDD